MIFPLASRTTTRTCTRLTCTLNVVGVSLVVTSSLGRCSSAAGGSVGAGCGAGAADAGCSGTADGTGWLGGGDCAGDCANEAAPPRTNSRQKNANCWMPPSGRKTRMLDPETAHPRRVPDNSTVVGWLDCVVQQLYAGVNFRVNAGARGADYQGAGYRG